MGEKSCEFCTYRWISLVQNPKSCPRCKRRFDYKDARIVLASIGKKYGWNISASKSNSQNKENQVLGVLQ